MAERRWYGFWDYGDVMHTRVRIGPDWTALAGNWLVEWERTEDSRWRDRIVTGLADVGAMPYGLFSGFAGAMGFDPTTAHLYYDGREFSDSMNLSMLFGGAELPPTCRGGRLPAGRSGRSGPTWPATWPCWPPAPAAVTRSGPPLTSSWAGPPGWRR